MDNFYRGPALLLTGAAEIPVETALFTERRGPENPWSGTVRATGDKPLWADLNGDTARLRLPDGRQGTVTVQGSGFGAVEVSGTGPPPS